MSSQSQNSYFLENQDTPMKVTDLLDECLEHIFGYLKMEELFNVALANANFVDIATLIFKRKYGKMAIKVHPHEIYAYMYGNHLYERFKIDWVKPLNEFAFLRIFGKSISKLYVVSYVGMKMENAMKSYVSKYCPCDVLTIQFVMPSRWTSFVRTFRWKYIDEQLFRHSPSDLSSSLESLSIRCYDQCFLGRSNITLDHVKHLSFVQLEWARLEPPATAFPNLELLAIQTMYRLSEEWFQFIEQNKHLIKLGLFSHERRCFDNDLLLNLVAGLPKLKVLAINELNINIDFIGELLESSTSLKHLRLYEGWWDDEKSFNSMLISRGITQIREKWDVYADYRCATFIRKIELNQIETVSMENLNEMCTSERDFIATKLL